MDMTLSLAAITAFRRSFNYRPDWTQEQALHMYGSLAVALIIWKLVEVKPSNITNRSSVKGPSTLSLM